MIIARRSSGHSADWLFRLIVGTAVLLTVLHVYFFLHWGPQRVVTNIGWFIPVTLAFQSLSALSVAFLALGRCEVLKDSVSYWTGIGFGVFGLELAYYVLTWPGLAPNGGAILGHLPSTAAWIGMAAISIFAACLIAASMRPSSNPRYLLRRIAAWLLVALLIGILAVVFEYKLPTLVDTNGVFTPLLTGWQWVVTCALAVGAILSARLYVQHQDPLPGYVAITQIAMAFAQLTTALGGRRYVALGFVDRLISMATFIAALFGLLSGYVHLYRREHEKTEALRESEQRFRELNQQLEARVRQRTEQLQSLNKELEAFSYSVSHDLRAPLRTLDGFSQALLGTADGLDHKARHYLERIRAASQRMRHLIDGLLQLSRTTRAELQMDTVDLSEIARSVVDDLRTSEPGRSVEVRIEPGLQARGDPRLLQAALQNLLGNAWKFTSHRDHGVIEFGQLNNRPHPAFFVRDNGAGFDGQQAEHLFAPFHRLHSDAEFQGTGIGLATVQRIIARHGGRIWAEATPNQGATFYFELGGADDNTTEPESTAATAQRRKTVDSAGRG